MSDALEELMKEKRPSVEPRSEQLDINNDKHIGIGVSSNIDSNKPTHQVVRNSILIEKLAHEELTEYCDHEKIIKAVWIEAAFFYLKKHPEAMRDILESARNRHRERKEFTKDRQAMTFSKRLNKST